MGLFFSYCLFENTTSVMNDCVLAIKNENISDEELRYAKRLRELCEQYINNYDYYIDEDDNEI